ncbi:hypothetical protein NQ314_014576 [Rhamnusium bicolor]|uniref:CCHC-type domain-containing protein n=1 Tax=Rhamnusium bicolor TaxID=1586634 RepID=A0AAV8X2G9_9CUCU|nr:hypothetical protein NQ314_014576 [Rhamnusium bicolor]
MENIFECLSEKPSEDRKLRTLMATDLPHYQSHLALQNVSTVSRLVEICRALKNSEKAKKSFKPPPRKQISTLEPGLDYNPTLDIMPADTSSRDTNREIFFGRSNPSSRSHPSGFRQVSALHCWQRNEAGHIKRDCPKKSNGPTCYGCGKKNVIRPNCSKCSNNMRLGNNQ